MTALSIGQKVKNFRIHRQWSQQELEMEIDAASGSISRIEAGKVNPTKETLQEIADSLQLSVIERSYLHGIIDTEPTVTEIKNIIDSCNYWLKGSDKYSYLLDLKSRVLAWSDGFIELGKANKVDLNKLLHLNICEILFDPSLGLRQFIDAQKFDSVGVPVLAVVKQERNYLLNDPWWKAFLDRLLLLPDANRLWEYVQEQELDLQDASARRVSLNINGDLIEMEFTMIILPTDSRFSIISYSII